MTVLNDPVLSGQEKTSRMQEIGAKFRRDILIPEQINLLNNAIEDSKFMLAFDKSLSSAERSALEQSITGMQQNVNT